MTLHSATFSWRQHIVDSPLTQMPFMSKDKSFNSKPNTKPDSLRSSNQKGTSSAATGSQKVGDKLRAQVEIWRKKLLDIGNRNSLINAALSTSRGIVEVVFPECDSAWSKLATSGEANSPSVRFPWKRDLVPPAQG